MLQHGRSPGGVRRRGILGSASARAAVAPARTIGRMDATRSRPAAADARWPRQLAAIDMGSNSFRLEIGQLQHGRYRRIDYLKETVRLGAGLDADGLLTEEAAQRGLACLRRFAQRLQRLRAAAGARGGHADAARGAQPRCLPAARAGGAGPPDRGHLRPRGGAPDLRRRRAPAAVRRAAPGDRHRRALDRDDPRPAAARRCGPNRSRSAASACRCATSPTAASARRAFRAAQIAAGAELEEALEPFAPQHWQEALGSSGTVGAVSQLLAASGVTDGRITPEGLRWCIARCLQAGHIDKLALPGAAGRPARGASPAAWRSSTRWRRTSASTRCSRRAARCARA